MERGVTPIPAPWTAQGQATLVLPSPLPLLPARSPSEPHDGSRSQNCGLIREASLPLRPNTQPGSLASSPSPGAHGPGHTALARPPRHCAPAPTRPLLPARMPSASPPPSLHPTRIETLTAAQGTPLKDKSDQTPPLNFLPGPPPPPSQEQSPGRHQPAGAQASTRHLSPPRPGGQSPRSGAGGAGS